MPHVVAKHSADVPHALKLEDSGSTALPEVGLVHIATKCGTSISKFESETVIGIRMTQWKRHLTLEAEYGLYWRYVM